MYFWVDLLCAPASLDAEAMQQLMAAVGCALVVVTPWRRPVLLTRAWALLDLYTAVVADARVEFALPRAQLEALRATDADTLQEALAELAQLDVDMAEVRTAACTWPCAPADANAVLRGVMPPWLRQLLVAYAAELTAAEPTEDVGCTLDRVATLLREIGDTQEAMAASRQAEQILDTAGVAAGSLVRAQLFEHRASILVAMADWAEAVRTLNAAEAMFVQAHGTQVHVDVCRVVKNLARAYKRMGDNDQAVHHYMRSLELVVEAYPEDHPNVGQSFMILGETAMQQGQLDRALVYLTKARRVLLARHGSGDHADVARTLAALADVYHQYRDLPQALDLYTKAQTSYIHAYATDQHPNVARVDVALGHIYIDQGRLEAAAEHLRKALGIFEVKLGPDHATTNSCKSALASLAGAQSAAAAAPPPASRRPSFARVVLPVALALAAFAIVLSRVPRR